VKNNITSVGVNAFVRRQVSGSGKTYTSSMSFEEIASVAEEQLRCGNFKAGYRNGVCIVLLPPQYNDEFICPFVKIDQDSALRAELVKRREAEEPYIQIRATSGNPAATGKVELILYRNDVLAENNEQSTDKDWELISIHAIPEGVEKLPMGPVTMMRNQLQLPGGTKACYSSEEWAESVRFWQQYAALDM
tara:strand:- start:123 stop:695 length:573 start_codon:yes stop_codon:yes gene_type:complete